MSTSLAVRCAFLTYRLPTDWYLPAGEPRGLVWAQHGFTESRKVWLEFATRAAGAGLLVVAPTLPTADLFGCTVQNFGNNTRFLARVAEVLGAAPADDRADGAPDHLVGTGALATSYLAAVRKSGRLEVDSAAVPIPAKVAFVGHSAGGEAALYLARRLTEVHRENPQGRGGGHVGDAGEPVVPDRLAVAGVVPDRLEVAGVVPDRLEVAGVVLADPVTSLVDRTMAPSLQVLVSAGLPVLTQASPPNSCNAHHRGVDVVVAGLASRRFIGVQLTTGSHADLLGASVGAVERRVCGTPEPQNIEAAQALAVGWLVDMLDHAGSDPVGGTAGDAGRLVPADSQPGGATYEALLSAGVIVPLG